VTPGIALGRKTATLVGGKLGAENEPERKKPPSKSIDSREISGLAPNSTERVSGDCQKHCAPVPKNVLLESTESKFVHWKRSFIAAEKNEDPKPANGLLRRLLRARGLVARVD